MTPQQRTIVLTHGGVERPPFAGMGARFLRGVCVLLIAALLNTSLAPLVHAAQRKLHAPPKAAAIHEDNFRTAALDNSASVRALQSEAEALRTHWRELRAKWEAAGVDDAILRSQLEMERAFERRYEQHLALLQAAGAPDATAADRQALVSFLAAEHEDTASLTDLNNLPWQSLRAESTNEPVASEEALAKKLQLPQQPAQPAQKSQRKDALKGELTHTAADLAPTVDAPHTDAIKQLAAELGHNPHRIWQWVRNNIGWLPTHGSVQGAQDTLDKKAGNAADTTSLLIALLRASGIPARYVYGTVDIPAERAMNWTGTRTIEAAQQIIGQGGIPNTVLTRGGQAFAIRIEHVWAEALIQYHPGRGARHIAGQSTPDTWLPIDASYKQYEEQAGMDLGAAVPINPEELITAASKGASVNEAEGWVQHLNTAALQSQLDAYQKQLAAHIQQQNGGGSTVGDILGQRTIKPSTLPYLDAALPYTVQTRSRTFAEIPSSLKARFRYTIHTDARSAAWGDGALLHFEAPTAELAGKKVTLAWVAASEADRKALESLIPQGITDPSQLPRTIPAAINVKPQIIVEGEVKAEGTPMKVGSEPVGVGAFTQYGTGQWDRTRDKLIAGQQTALGLSIQGVSSEQMQRLQTRMESTKATLERAQKAPESQRAEILKAITGEQFTGDLLTASIWGYFAALQSHGQIAASQAKMIDLPALSYGLFHAQVRPNKLYGIVTTGITMEGLNIDVGHLRHIRWTQDDNPESAINNEPGLNHSGRTAAHNRWIAYNKMRGQYGSAMEHAIPEQFWVDRNKCSYLDDKGNIKNPSLPQCAEAISAVKAIAIAQNQGQKIYTINKDNAATALAKLPGVNAEIRSAIEAGKEVSFHEKAISAHGWSGQGYIIVDPETGAGAYLIEGKGNGGWLNGVTIGWILTIIILGGGFVGIIIEILPASLMLALSLLVFEVFNVYLWLDSISNAQNDSDIHKANLGAILGALIFMLPIRGVNLENVIRWWGYIFVSAMSMIMGTI